MFLHLGADIVVPLRDVIAITDFKSGKQAALGFLVGQMMKLSQGKANPKLANEILVKKLS